MASEHKTSDDMKQAEHTRLNMSFGQVLITALGHAHPTRLVCVHVKLGVLGLLHVVGSLMFNCHCLLHASDKYSNLD